MNGKRTREIQPGQKAPRVKQRTGLHNTEPEEELERSAHPVFQRGEAIPSIYTPSDIIDLQHSRGNQAVQRLLHKRKQPGVVQRVVNEEGKKVFTWDNARKQELLNRLLDGVEDITTYTPGVCYDAVAFIQYLRGLVTSDQLDKTVGEAWINPLRLFMGTQWVGEVIPRGSAVGFERVGDYKPGFFHAAVATGGTTIRAVNGLDLGAGWSVPVDLLTVLGKPDNKGECKHDGQPIIVYYL